MSTYLVFERVPDSYASGQVFAAKVGDFANQLITCVEADSPKGAIDLVMAATRRVGQYAVIECEYFSFTADVETATSSDGLLKARGADPVKQLEQENNDRMAKLERELEQLHKLAND